MSTTKPADPAAPTQHIVELAMAWRTLGELLHELEVTARSIIAWVARAAAHGRLTSDGQHHEEIM